MLPDQALVPPVGSMPTFMRIGPPPSDFLASSPSPAQACPQMVKRTLLPAGTLVTRLIDAGFVRPMVGEELLRVASRVDAMPCVARPACTRACGFSMPRRLQPGLSTTASNRAPSAPCDTTRTAHSVPSKSGFLSKFACASGAAGGSAWISPAGTTANARATTTATDNIRNNRMCTLLCGSRAASGRESVGSSPAARSSPECEPGMCSPATNGARPFVCRTGRAALVTWWGTALHTGLPRLSILFPNDSVDVASNSTRTNRQRSDRAADRTRQRPRVRLRSRLRDATSLWHSVPRPEFRRSGRQAAHRVKRRFPKRRFPKRRFPKRRGSMCTKTL